MGYVIDLMLPMIRSFLLIGGNGWNALNGLPSPDPYGDGISISRGGMRASKRYRHLEAR